MKKPINQFFVILIFFMILNACEKNTVSVDGTITNISGRKIQMASVMLYHQGTTDIVYSTTSDESGYYIFEKVEEGYYDLDFSAQGYQELKSGIHLKDNHSQDVVLIGSASISGNVIDAQTGLGVDSVIVAFTTDTSVTSINNAQLIVKTDYYGYFNLDSFPTGTFRVIIDTPSYIPRIIDDILINTGTNALADFSLLSLPEVGYYRIILTWGFDPSDLDSHITGPDGSGGRIHVCYWNDSTEDGSISLDLDDSWRYGPETFTIHNLKDGTYNYSVHNYTDQSVNGGSGIYGSPAHVEIVGSEGLIEEFMAPPFTNSAGNTWRVFEINVAGTDINFNPISTYLFAEDDSDLEAFKINKLEKKVAK